MIRPKGTAAERWRNHTCARRYGFFFPGARPGRPSRICAGRCVVADDALALEGRVSTGLVVYGLAFPLYPVGYIRRSIGHDYALVLASDQKVYAFYADQG